MLAGADDEDAAEGSEGCRGQLFKRVPRRSDAGNDKANKVDAVIGEGPEGLDWEHIRVEGPEGSDWEHIWVVREASDWELAIVVRGSCILSAFFSRELPGILGRAV